MEGRMGLALHYCWFMPCRVNYRANEKLIMIQPTGSSDLRMGSRIHKLLLNFLTLVAEQNISAAFLVWEYLLLAQTCEKAGYIIVDYFEGDCYRFFRR